LDWFHLTMKLTVLGQFGKGLVHCEAVLGEAIRDQIERLTWSLWHGQVDKALGKIDDRETSMEPFRGYVRDTCKKVSQGRDPHLGADTLDDRTHHRTADTAC